MKWFSLFERMFPHLRTDHGGLTFGDVAVFLMSAVATLFTAWRSYDILMHTLPGNDSTYTLIAIAGLFFLDLGAIMWALTWVFGSATPYQDWISLGMWIVDMMGVLVAVLADTFLYTDMGGALVNLVQVLAWWVVPILAVLNLTAGMVYHFVSPAAQRRRELRRVHARLELQRIQGEAEARKQELEVELAKELVAKRQQAIQAYQTLVQLHRQLSQAELMLATQLLGEEGRDLPLGEAFLKALGGESGKAKKEAGEAPKKPSPTPAEPSRNDGHPHFTTLDTE